MDNMYSRILITQKTIFKNESYISLEMQKYVFFNYHHIIKLAQKKADGLLTDSWFV